MASNNKSRLLLRLLVFISCPFLHEAALRTTTFLKVTSGSSPSSLGLYHAPSVYGKGARPLRSYIITSRPLTFTKKPLSPSSSDATGSGVAAIVCKGKSCAPTTESPGFSGEAIPLPDDDVNTVAASDLHETLGNGHSGSTPVVLNVERPYIKRKQSLTTKEPSTTTTQRPLRRQRVTTSTTTTTTTQRPNTRRPFGIGSLLRPWNPNRVFPAVAAFTLVALPLAAVAAAPLFVSGGRRRKRHDDDEGEENLDALLGQLEFWLTLDEDRYKALEDAKSSEDLGKMMEKAKDAAKVLRPIWSGNIFRRKSLREEMEGIQ